MVGQICFANDGGLGIQTKRLYEMIKPDKVLLIDSRGFSKNKQFHSDWYPEEITTTVNGFPRNYDIAEWIKGLKTVFTVENPYNFYLVWKCREQGIKTICQTNYEFCENLVAPWLPVPDLFLMPSHWMVDDMKERFGHDRVKVLPPPLDPNTFHYVGDSKYGTPNFLHIVGTLAANDRNGTLDLLQAVMKSKGDYRLTIHSQHKLPDQYIINDKRVTYRIKNFEKTEDLYKGFQALILPRRYGGLSLTTNEALMSGLPVMMTDISPNNILLPKSWLIPARKVGEFQVRASISYYESDLQALANKLDQWSKSLPNSFSAHKIALDNFKVQTLAKEYEKLL
jgi:glycosyltransferase involved in cell wall biosynthesis